MYQCNEHLQTDHITTEHYDTQSLRYKIITIFWLTLIVLRFCSELWGDKVKPKTMKKSENKRDQESVLTTFHWWYTNLSTPKPNAIFYWITVNSFLPPILDVIVLVMVIQCPEWRCLDVLWSDDFTTKNDGMKFCKIKSIRIWLTTSQIHHNAFSSW